MATWPTSLPQEALAQGLQEAGQGAVIRSTVDVGPAKTRPRYTKEMTNVTIPLTLTRDQKDTLEAFYKTTLALGALSFTWVFPSTGATVEFRFLSRPGYAPAGIKWRTALALEVML